MSKYTTEVRFICEHSAGLPESVGYNSIDSVLDASREKVFDFDYPIFDEAYRVTLEKKILKHYYTREICCETVGLWKLFLNRKMNEIMPYYNQLYKSALIEFNPMYDIDLTTTHQRVNNGENESNKAINEVGKYNENSSEAMNENTRGEYNENSSEGSNESTEGTYSENTSGAKNELTSGSSVETANGTINENDVYGENKSRTNTGTSNEKSTKSDNSATNQTSHDDTHSETSTESANKNDHWEYFSDTPEGGINGVEDLSYLTNATHITDDGDGTTSGSETDSDKDVTMETLSNSEAVGEKNDVVTENGVDTTSSDRVKDIEDNKIVNKDNASATTTDNNSNTIGDNDKITVANSEKNLAGDNEKVTNKDNSKATTGDNSKDINESNNETIRNIEDYMEHVVGKRCSMSYSKMLEEFRKTFLNIDMLVINDLRDLFLNLW